MKTAHLKGIDQSYWFFGSKLQSVLQNKEIDAIARPG
jgi:hypothetical protein